MTKEFDNRLVPFSSFERDLESLLDRLTGEESLLKGILILFEYKNGDTDANTYGDPDLRILIGEMSGVEYKFWAAVSKVKE